MTTSLARTVVFRNRSYAALLFDMDGTMLDSTTAVQRVWRKWAMKVGANADELLATVHGVRAEDTIRRFGPNGLNLANEVEAILQAEIADMDGVVPIAGISEFISTLDSRTWAVVTSAQRALARARLGAANIPLPDVLITAEDVKRGKPDPEGYLIAAERLGVSIHDCLIFEDSHAGVAAAKAAGARVAIVGKRVSPPPEMLSISDFME